MKTYTELYELGIAHSVEVWNKDKKCWEKWTPENEKKDIEQLTFTAAMAPTGACAACMGTGKDSKGQDCWACAARKKKAEGKLADRERARIVKAALLRGDDIYWCDICSDFCLEAETEKQGGKIYCGVCGAVVRNPDKGLLEDFGDSQIQDYD